MRRVTSYMQIHQLYQRRRTKTEQVSGVRGQPVGHQIVGAMVGGGCTTHLKVLNETEVDGSVWGEAGGRQVLGGGGLLPTGSN